MKYFINFIFQTMYYKYGNCLYLTGRMVYDDMDDQRALNVIIVEDSVFFADITARILKRNGLDVNCRIVSTKAALESGLQEELWDIILSDNVMPGFSALGAIAIRNAICRETPFLIVSEDISDRELKEAFEKGCNAFLPKERIAELPDLIRKHIYGKDV